MTVFDAGEDDGDLFIVMELVDGPSLAHHLARTGPPPIDETVRLAVQVLSVLAAAHAAGIVHRDVKPANILIAADGETKLADFGIAKRFDDLDASVTSVGTVIGTPRYLAPEQALGLPVTPATDVYAMGIVLFEMLTGRLPFEADSPAAAALARQSRPAPDGGPCDPTCPRPWHWRSPAHLPPIPVNVRRPQPICSRCSTRRRRWAPARPRSSTRRSR